MKKFASVAAYLRAVPPAPRAALQKLRKTIKAAAPKATEVISYGIPMSSITACWWVTPRSRSTAACS